MGSPEGAVAALARAIEDFEATESRSHLGTGARREGEQFEALVMTWWAAVAGELEASADVRLRRASDGRLWTRVGLGNRALYLPAAGSDPAPPVPRDEWFATTFLVSDLLAAFPGQATMVARHAPESGPFAGARYSDMYSRMHTEFDGTVVCEEDGVLSEKLLLEYKTAKSSTGRQIDGNAHERLSYQVLQYLEVATRFPSCSFVVLANGAFAKYRNKYHPSFRAQAERLAAFEWFHMEHICQAGEYVALASRLAAWLKSGTPIYRAAR